MARRSASMLAPRMRKVAVPATMQDAHLPGPVGGLNTTDVGARMPPTDAISLFNLVSSELGMRVRNGWQEWVTGLTGGDVRSVIPYKGAAGIGNDRLFCTTPTGIWDISNSTQTPTQVITFPVQSSVSGYGIYTTLTPTNAPAASYLLYTDEENGYYLYSESTNTWQKVVINSQAAWIANHGYTAGQYVLNGGNVYLCTQTGTSAGSGGPTGTGTGIVDNTCLWNFNFSVTGVDPATFAFVTVWKGNALFVQKGTQTIWYLNPLFVGGTATSLGAAQICKHGGFLVGLWNWSVDGGQGIDNHLVLIFSSGDVAVFKGNSITASNFGLVSVWWVGAVVAGRRIATEFGGDILILSATGLIPLSKVVLGNVFFDRSQYVTYKITTLFANYFQLYGTNLGWTVNLDPSNNAIMIQVPSAPTQLIPGVQLVMSVATRAWSVFPDLPMWTGESWNGVYYMGTTDGRILRFTGFVDGVTLANPSTSGTPIQFSLLTAFQNLGNAKKKQVHHIRPIISTGGPAAYESRSWFDYDIEQLGAFPGTGSLSGTNLWDIALWDSDLWGGDFNPTMFISGGQGIGANVAVGLRGAASGKTILVGFDVSFDQAGFL